MIEGVAVRRKKLLTASHDAKWAQQLFMFMCMSVQAIGYVIQFSFDLHLCVSYCEYAHRTRQMRISNFLKASINPECSNHSVNSDRLYGALEMGRFVCLISRLWDERDFRWGWTWLWQLYLTTSDQSVLVIQDSLFSLFTHTLHLT